MARAAVFPRHLRAAGDAGGKFFLHDIYGVTGKGFDLGAQGLGGFEGVGFLLRGQGGLGFDEETSGLGEYGAVAGIGGASLREKTAKGEVGIGGAAGIVFGDGLAEPGIGEGGMEPGGLGKVGDAGIRLAEGHLGGGEAVERPRVAGFEFEGAELETLREGGLSEAGVDVAQDDEAPGVGGGEFEGVDESVFGGVEPAQLHQAHGDFTMGGGVGGSEGEDAFVELDRTGEITIAGAFGGAFGEAPGLLLFGKGGVVAGDVGDAIGDGYVDGAEKGEMLAKADDQFVGGEVGTDTGKKEVEVGERNRQMHGAG